MSNASPALSSLADSLDSLRHRMKPTDERQHRVLAAELNSRSLAMLLMDDISEPEVMNIHNLAGLISVLKPNVNSAFDSAMDDVEALHVSLSSPAVT